MLLSDDNGTISSISESNIGPSIGRKGVLEEINEFKSNFVHFISNLCGQWAGIVYDHPYKISLIGYIVAFGSLFGFVPGIAQWVDGAENLYALPHTQAKNDGLLHNSIFHDSLSLANFVIITSDPPGSNIFTWEHLRSAQQIDNLVRGKAVDPLKGRRIGLVRPKDELNYSVEGNVKGPQRTAHAAAGIFGYGNKRVESAVSLAEDIDSVVTFEDLCAPSPFGKCQVTSIFEMGIWDMQKVLHKSAAPELYVLKGMIFNTGGHE